MSPEGFVIHWAAYIYLFFLYKSVRLHIHIKKCISKNMLAFNLDLISSTATTSAGRLPLKPKKADQYLAASNESVLDRWKSQRVYLITQELLVC